MWFLIVLLQLESNASSFSPGRADQYLYPYYRRDMDEGRLTLEEAQEILDAAFIKFNQIVYMRNTDGAAFFAGFPIHPGFPDMELKSSRHEQPASVLP